MAAVLVMFTWLCSSAGGKATAPPQEMREIYQTTDSAGRVSVYRVQESKLLATRKWSPEAEEPPLSVSSAVKLAMKRLRAKRTGPFQVIVVELSASGGREWRWFYRVNVYDLATAKGPQGPETVDVVVLMDGSVVEPSLSTRLP
jgi:hypothetical protein